MNSNISDDEESSPRAQQQVFISDGGNATVVKTEGTMGRRRSKSSIMYQKATANLLVTPEKDKK
jgi:hypothetical protein